MSRLSKKSKGTEENQAQNSSKKSFSLPRKFFLGLVGIVGIVLLISIILVGKDIPPLDEIENPQSNLATQVISLDGEVLQNFYTRENRVNIPLHKISPHLIDALIATEDLRFYRHSGLDMNTVPAIIIRYLRGTTSGGSTITMQLARNLFDAVGTQRTVTRKIKEIIVSAILEQRFTKQEILTAYLNTVSIYGQTYGVEMASRRLFGKPAKEVALEEAAVLVAMLKGQGVFNPYRNPDTVIFRRNVVINKMVENGFLSIPDTELDSVKGLPLDLAARGKEHVEGLAPYFREHIRLFMGNWCKERGYNLYTDGLKIYTSIDTRLQRYAEEAVEEHLSERQKTFEEHLKITRPFRNDPDIVNVLMRQSGRYAAGLRAGQTDTEIRDSFNEPRKMSVFTWKGNVDTVMTPKDSILHHAKYLETGLVSIDPVTGYIKAWVGGINFEHFKYDHVAKGKRQVGSTFKPFVYAAAMDNGRQPCDEILNQPVFFENVDGEGERWSPSNSNNSVGGMMTLRRGLASSTNLITARLMKDIGPQVVVDYAKKMGIKSDLEAVPALCLGTCDLNVLELTGAYSTFVNKGVYVEPIFITRIEDRNGNVIQEFSPTTNQVLSRIKAYEMVELLKGVVDEPGGTASRLRYQYDFKNEIGGKTGTTQNHSDAWFVGVMPQLITGVWVGCADRRIRFERMDLGQGASQSLPIWALYMKKVLADEDLNFPQEPFAIPSGYYSRLACDSSYFDKENMLRAAPVKKKKKDKGLGF
ncbi:MAG: transglycosylase domain-containing protein [Bacteroidota bacterium]